VEARDLNYDRTGSDPKLRMDTVSGGAIYTWRHYRNVHPYAKFLVGYGSIDFSSSRPNYTHDSRTVYAPGGGLDYRVYRNVWVRGNYEYQAWTDFFNHHALNPQGFTIGAAYDFSGIHRR
jgi:opacity protein-like surface antigen